jgi:uncharacterized membrane protein
MPGSRGDAWLIPLSYAVGAIVLGFTVPRLEIWLLPGWSSGISAQAAIALDSAVAAGMFTLTGIVFSMVFVMVQFSATAYSPRLVLWIAQNSLISHAIGVFTATFLYAVAALVWVDRHNSGRVPLFSSWLVVGFLLVSVGIFIELIFSVTRLQVHNVLAFTGDFARAVIDRMYPPLGSSPVFGSSPGEDRSFGESALSGLDIHAISQTLTHQGAPRSIQSLDLAALVRLAERAGGVIEMASAVGDTLVVGTPILQVRGQPLPEAELRKAIRTGPQRTFDQDPKYSLHLLSDIAVRALSPAVNDPTTAVQALDQIEDLLLRLGSRRLEIGQIWDPSGHLRLAILVPSWEDFLDLGLSQIRSYGASSLQVSRRMKALLSALMVALPESRRQEVRVHQGRLARAVARAFPDIEDAREASVEDREGMGAARHSRVPAR